MTYTRWSLISEKGNPPENTIVFVWTDNDELFLCRYQKGAMGWDFRRRLEYCNMMSKWQFPVKNATHWRTLPPGPKEGHPIECDSQVLAMLFEVKSMFKKINPDFDKRIKALLDKILFDKNPNYKINH